jgi:hypothetical protein
VPEEHVEAVMRFVLQATEQASLEPWDAEAVSKTFIDVDEATRSLLSFVARAALEGVELAEVDAAGRIQLTPRETAGIMADLNNLTRESGRPNLLDARTVTERLPNGRTNTKRVLTMTREIAEYVRAAEDAELAAAPHPLGMTE